MYSFLQKIRYKYLRCFIFNILQKILYNNIHKAKQLVLEDIDSILRVHGQSNIDFGIPAQEDIVFNDFIYDPNEEFATANRLIPTLNRLQKLIFEEICTIVDSTVVDNKFYFLDGPGRSGKTYLYNTIMIYLQGRNRNVLAFTATGIAADLLKGG